MNTTMQRLPSGFRGAEARALLALKLRYQSGELREDWTADELRRLEFVRWLVQQARLSS